MIKHLKSRSLEEINAKLRDTKTEFIGGKYYCAFCGKEAQYQYEFEDYEKIHFHFCDCEAAKLFLQIEDLQYKLSKMTDTKKLNLLRYEEELKSLKCKYDLD